LLPALLGPKKKDDKKTPNSDSLKRKLPAGKDSADLKKIKKQTPTGKPLLNKKTDSVKAIQPPNIKPSASTPTNLK
jgi:hypothetical protein